MRLPDTAKINQQGHLEIAGCDVVGLAKTYGTPLYLLDQATIAHLATQYQKAFSAILPNSKVLYASKANSTLRVLRTVAAAGLGVDVVSGGELYAALRAGVKPETIYFHGNNKSTEELSFALEQQIGRIVVDSLDELKQLAALAAQGARTVPVMLRLIPGIEAHTHEFIQTGKLDSKFGIPSEMLPEAMTYLKTASHLRCVGIHAHIGSQILEVAPFVEAALRLLDFAATLAKTYGVVVEEINVGGGLGIAYTEEEAPPTIDALATAIGEKLRSVEKKLAFPLPRFLVEPGRSIVGPAGVTLYRVGTIKSLPGIRTYAAVDGGMSDNPRPILYQAIYEALVANRANAPRITPVTLAGKHCESGDLLIKDILLPPLSQGDIIAVACTGAYNAAMASNYNRMCRPATVWLEDGRAECIVRRETYEDLLRQEGVA